MSRRKSQWERQERRLERGGRCASGDLHDWQEKPGYGTVCATCGAKRAPR